MRPWRAIVNLFFFVSLIFIPRLEANSGGCFQALEDLAHESSSLIFGKPQSEWLSLANTEFEKMKTLLERDRVKFDVKRQNGFPTIHILPSNQTKINRLAQDLFHKTGFTLTWYSLTQILGAGAMFLETNSMGSPDIDDAREESSKWLIQNYAMIEDAGIIFSTRLYEASKGRMEDTIAWFHESNHGILAKIQQNQNLNIFHIKSTPKNPAANDAFYNGMVPAAELFTHMKDLLKGRDIYLSLNKGHYKKEALSDADMEIGNLVPIETTALTLALMEDKAHRLQQMLKESQLFFKDIEIALTNRKNMSYRQVGPNTWADIQIENGGRSYIAHIPLKGSEGINDPQNFNLYKEMIKNFEIFVSESTPIINSFLHSMKAFEFGKIPENQFPEFLNNLKIPNLNIQTP